MDNTQISVIRTKLTNGERITSMEAFDLGITRLAAIIHVLRHDEGMNIITNKCHTQNRYGHTTQYAEYVLVGGGNS